ncbi:MAG: hypothetical protein RIE24_15395 [Silicimonas sp.]
MSNILKEILVNDTEVIDGRQPRKQERFADTSCLRLPEAWCPAWLSTLKNLPLRTAGAGSITLDLQPRRIREAHRPLAIRAKITQIRLKA